MRQTKQAATGQLGWGVLTVLAVLVLPSGASATEVGVAAPIDAAATAARVQARYDETRTMSGRFVQEVALGASGRVLRSEGTMHFRKPGRMRWEYATPEPQTLIANGETLWIYQPEENQVLRAKLAGAFDSQTPVSFLFGVARLERDFRPELLAPAADGSLRLKLVPKNAAENSAHALVLEVDPESWDLRAAIVRDVLGNQTRVELLDVQRNLPLADALFEFKRPPGTDLIEAPGGG
ncbi:MAG: outer membrane lipoprotein chaperone LolA [Deltaproteobacteria bacterium]